MTREFKMPWRAGMTQHHAIETIVISERSKFLETQAVAIKPDDGVEMIIAERPSGSFSRQLFLGDTLDTAKLEADYTDGVLTVRLPVTERAKPRRVPIGRSADRSAAIEVGTDERAADTHLEGGGAERERELAGASG